MMFECHTHVKTLGIKMFRPMVAVRSSGLVRNYWRPDEGVNFATFEKSHW